jgi:glycosyltransferase involved in cell wall biosynthesis
VSYITGQATALPVPSSSEAPNRAEGDVVILRAPVYAAHHRSFLHRVVAFVSFMLSSVWLGLHVPDVDVVWGTSPPIFQGLSAWVVARLKRARFLFEVRDLWPKFAVAVGVLRVPILIKAAEWLERFLYRRADQLLVNSPGFLEHVRRCGSQRVELIPNGADPSMFDPASDGQAFRLAHGLDGRFIALYAGAHGMSNDLDVVLDAAGMLKDRADILVVLLGDGKEKSALQQRAVEMGLTNVAFAAPVAKGQMPDALAAADACIAILKPLDEYKTTYPNKVFDYMAAGRPVVLAIDGVIREVVEGAKAGCAVPPGDPIAMAEAIRALAADPERARAMGFSGRVAVQAKFNRADLSEKLAQLLESMGG